MPESDQGNADGAKLIVVELFPMRASGPRNLPDMLAHMVQLQYSSRLVLHRGVLRRDRRPRAARWLGSTDLPGDSAVRTDPVSMRLSRTGGTTTSVW